MAVLDSKTTYKSLKKKGFEDSNRTNKDHKFLDFYHDGKLTPYWTKISHGNEDIRDHLINKMAKQIGLPTAQFIEFAKCNLDKSEYVKYLVVNNKL